MANPKKKLIIIGGGAVGFFVAANIDGTRYDTLLLERAKQPMQKIKIAGGGRCNVTHACFDPRELVNYFPRGNRELRSVFSKFQPADTIAWFKERGLELKTEADNRMFPVTDSSESVMKVLEEEALKNGIQFNYSEGVTQLDRVDGHWEVQTKKNRYQADFVVFCTGGSPKAYKMLDKLGVKLIDLVPSLFTFNIKDKELQALMGTSFDSASVEVLELKASESGPLLITHWGLSGPAVLKLSAWCAREFFKLNYHFTIKVNFLDRSMEETEELLMNYKRNHPRKSLGKAKVFDISQRFWEWVLKRNYIDFEKQMAHLNKQETESVIKTLCACEFPVTGKSTFKEEFVTAGGVDLKQVDFKTMRLKSLENFYAAGEVLDIDALTGGFNFQACWSEAWLITQDLNNNLMHQGSK